MSASLVEQWLARGYTRQISFVPEHEGGYWLAWVPQFGRHSMAGAGSSPLEALASLDEVLADAFEMLAEAGEEPDLAIDEGIGQDRPSGKLTLRLSPALHARLQAEADIEQQSLNAYLVSCLAQARSDSRLRQIVRDELALALEAHHEVPAAPAAAVALAAWEVEEQRTEAGALREVA